MHRLTRPLTLRCGLALADRVALAPLTNTQSHDDGTLGDDEYDWLVHRAKSGFRYVTTCAAFVSDEGHAWRGQLGIASDAHLPGLTRLAAGLRAAGATAVVQLHHGGYQAKLAPNRPLSTFEGAPNQSRGATESDLGQVIADFAAAARRAEQAGFAGVEVHGANGYLLTQFLAPVDNPRTDRWGGALDGRARLIRAVMQAVRATVSPGFAVGVRLSPVDTWAAGGLTLDDGVQVGHWMAEDGADFVHLSLRDAAGPPPFEADRGPVVRAFRDALPANVPVFSCGGIATADDAVRAFDAGADVAVIGKYGIIHPDWPRLAATPGWAPTRPPWSLATLRNVAVSERFLTYLRNFPGLLQGGAPAR